MPRLRLVVWKVAVTANYSIPKGRNVAALSILTFVGVCGVCESLAMVVGLAPRRGCDSLCQSGASPQ